MYSAQDIQQFLSEKSAQLNACRHHLHQHPEIGLQLLETSAFIEKELRSYGVDEIHKGFGSSAFKVESNMPQLTKNELTHADMMDI